MSNVINFPNKKRLRQQENLQVLGDLLQQCYQLGMEPDPEMDIWLKTAQKRLDAYEDARQWQIEYLKK
jgi:hypothetical protein